MWTTQADYMRHEMGMWRMNIWRENEMFIRLHAAGGRAVAAVSGNHAFE